MESSGLAIRPLARADRAGWGRLWEHYLAFYETTRPASYFDAYFERLLSGDAHDYHCLLAVVDRPVGLAHYCLHAHGWQAEPVCYLQDLFVDPATRGTGTGRALIERVYVNADGRGAKGVYWTTQHFNAAGRRLYDRVGELTPFIKYQRPS
ncbi:acetyltransferase (GNAT) family protein [Hasllibacter halocynthiae]|uniref:Acetyltransferase (GNAT) family protein n=1 Tax=Hasllibacter halocynthiae TaxID=595589 RepID=A0A2T0X7H9_9RHOB|nr:GNAT family N-acetyltransferase [Hasllibacter halocynthiae]PRY94877.1 acetyltransferase (GNAT) family protein [Hasllibacter halocynthiae]